MDSLIIKILLSALGVTLTGVLGFWLGILKERINGIEKRIIDEKLKLLPELEGFIAKTEYEPVPFKLFTMARGTILPYYQRLKVLATGRKLKRLNDSWNDIENTDETEMLGSGSFGDFKDDEQEKFERVSTDLRSKLEAFKKEVERL